MTDLKADLCVILQDVKHVPLGASLEPIADRIIALFAEAMMSEKALDHAVGGYWEADPDVPRDYGDMQRAIIAALDAAVIPTNDPAPLPKRGQDATEAPGPMS